MNNDIPKTMDQHRATPLSAHEINSNNQMVNDLLKRAVSNAFRHGFNLRPGRIKSVNGKLLILWRGKSHIEERSTVQLIYI